MRDTLGEISVGFLFTAFVGFFGWWLLFGPV